MSGEQHGTVVVDTNVLLDWLVFDEPDAQPLVTAIRNRRVRCLASPTMRGELQRMLGHSSLARWSPKADQALALFDDHVSACAEPPPAPLRCTDPDDQVFIDVAVACRCRWLVTRDKALLKLRRRALAHGVLILTPASWPGPDADC